MSVREGWVKVGKYRYKNGNMEVYGKKRRSKKPKWYWQYTIVAPLHLSYAHCGSAPSRAVAMERAEYCQVITKLDEGEGHD